MTSDANNGLSIVLDEGRPIYQPSDVLSGTVHLHVARHVHALSVVVELCGVAVTQLYHNDEPDRIHRFLRTTRTLWTADSSSSIIEPGNYCWVFTIDFPTGTGKLPSSYQDARNSIRYFLRAQVKTPKMHKEPTCTLDLFFQDRIDVDSTRLRTPVVVDLDTEAYLGSFWKRLFRQKSAKGTVRATVTLPKRGYCPGDKVGVVLHVAHFTSLFIAQAIKVQLRQKIVYLGKNQVDTKRSTLVEAVTALDIPEGSTDSTIVCHLTLPPDLPATNIACNVVQITYKLKVSVRVTQSKFIQSKTLYLRFPLVVGTYRSSRDRGGGTAMWRAQRWQEWARNSAEQVDMSSSSASPLQPCDGPPDYVQSGDMRVMVWPESQPPTYEASITTRASLNNSTMLLGSVGTLGSLGVMSETAHTEGFLSHSLERNSQPLAWSASSTVLDEVPRTISLGNVHRSGSLSSIRQQTNRRGRRNILPI